MDTELMTPFIERGVIKPLSAITIRSMEDLGYGVDVSQADSYFLPQPEAPLGLAQLLEDALVDDPRPLPRGFVLLL